MMDPQIRETIEMELTTLMEEAIGIFLGVFQEIKKRPELAGGLNPLTVSRGRVISTRILELMDHLEKHGELENRDE